jgi:hypothetical protein
LAQFSVLSINYSPKCFIESALNVVPGNRKNGLLRFQLSDGLNSAEEVVALKVRVKDVVIQLVSQATLEVFPQTRFDVQNMFYY